MRRSEAALAAIVLALSIAACASARSGHAGGRPNRITRAEIMELPNAFSAYDVVRRLRPSWLRQRGTSSFYGNTAVVVYVDGTRRGGIPALDRVRAAAVDYIRFLDATDATQRFGTGHLNGAIVVYTR